MAMMEWIHAETGATVSGLVQGVGAVVLMLVIGSAVGTWLHNWTKR